MTRKREGELQLQQLFALYTSNVKNAIRELCDGHKAFLLRKARKFLSMQQPLQ